MALWAFSLLLAGGWSGCSKPASPPAPSTPQGAATPQRGGTLVLSAVSDIEGLNELITNSSRATADVLFRLFLPLLEEQPDFAEHPPTFKPALAERYEWSPDHLTLTFHLRRNVVWSDGVPVTAEDVRFTWQAHVSPEVAWDTAYTKEAIRDVEVVDPHTVRFHFTKVTPNQLIAANDGLILPKHKWGTLPFGEWRKSADFFRENLVVNGPFFLEKWTPQQEVVLTRNPRYFDPERPYVDRVVFRYLPDQTSRLAQLLNGDIHFVEQVPAEDVERIDASPKARVHAFWHRNYVFVGWNQANPLFTDRMVRRALTLAIDRQGIVDTLWGPRGRVATSPVVQNVWAYNRALKPWPYDPAEAKRLLAAAGWADADQDGILEKQGKKFRFELLTHSGNKARETGAVMIQEQLRRVGIDAQVRLIDFNTLGTVMRERKFDAAIMAWGMPTDLSLRYAFHSEEIDTGDNQMGYHNPEADRLIDEIAQITDVAQAKPQLDRLQVLIHEDQPMTFLWESQRLIGLSRRVHGADPNLLSALWHLEHWWLAPGP